MATTCTLTLHAGPAPGDTGSSAIEAVRGRSNLHITVLYPSGRCSETQELQMTTVKDRSVLVVEVEGDSDTLDVPIKRCFDDIPLKKEINLCSINSVNIARMLVQAVHFIYYYSRHLRVQREAGTRKPLLFVIPTGAGGHLAGASLAMQMLGMFGGSHASSAPEVSILCASNANDILCRLLQSGEFKPRQIIKTQAPAMDIDSFYNIERILYWIVGTGDAGSLVAQWMNSLEVLKRFVLPEEYRAKLERAIGATAIAEVDFLGTIRSVWADHTYLVCPHTAIGVCAGRAEMLNPKSPASRNGASVIVCATAHPAKFTEALMKALDMTKRTTPLPSGFWHYGNQWKPQAGPFLREVSDPSQWTAQWLVGMPRRLRLRKCSYGIAGEDWTARLRTLLIKAHAGACGNGWLNMQQPYRTIPRSVAVISVAAVLVCSIVAIKRRQTPASL
eukprot:scaffold4251_cov430-Prasinococcus_capsulatus_cf.AAC.6